MGLLWKRLLSRVCIEHATCWTASSLAFSLSWITLTGAIPPSSSSSSIGDCSNAYVVFVIKDESHKGWCASSSHRWQRSSKRSGCAGD